MARIRLNQEYRNKIANRIKQGLFQEDTQEKGKYDTYEIDNILMSFLSFLVMQLAVAFFYCQLQVSFNCYLSFYK